MAHKLISDAERLILGCRVIDDGCWNWIGRLDKDGYACQIKVGSRTDGTRKQMKAHRLAYQEFVGPLNPELVLDHKCKNKRCVNPWHLEQVTILENTRRWVREFRTHCPKGHPLFGANLKDEGIRRRCRTCLRDMHKRIRAKSNYKAAQEKYRASEKYVLVVQARRAKVKARREGRSV